MISLPRPGLVLTRSYCFALTRRRCPKPFNLATLRSTSTSAHDGATSGNLKRRIAVYGGTFDPPSVGHNDVIKRGLALCDTLIVACGINSTKNPIFSLDERLALLRRMVDAEIPERASDVQIACFDGLIVDFAKEKQADFLVRGLRAFDDFDMEMRMALLNRRLTGIETCFLMASQSNAHISSSLIRELARWKKSLPGFVPASIADEVYAKLGVPYERELR